MISGTTSDVENLSGTITAEESLSGTLDQNGSLTGRLSMPMIRYSEIENSSGGFTVQIEG